MFLSLDSDPPNKSESQNNKFSQILKTPWISSQACPKDRHLEVGASSIHIFLNNIFGLVMFLLVSKCFDQIDWLEALAIESEN